MFSVRSYLLMVAAAAVACGDNHSVSVMLQGSVSGLEGQGLEIRTSSGDKLDIAADGAFSFPTPVPFGTEYAVSVSRQPTSPTQTCTIANSSGKVEGDEGVTNINVTCQTGVFLVGGKVTGLSGSGLVLENNGGDALAVAADGMFTFATPVKSGAAFAVTVKTQPTGPSQTCTVSGGTGTVGNGAVSTVVVDCAVDRFTVGGMVSGLAGTVVLQNNNGDNITVSSNGSFAFPTTVASGAGYAVTVLTQPATPSQTCTVTSGSGNVTNANITSVRVDCSTNAFTVGGTVSGLDGTGLVLQNNAGDNLPISSDGPFTFTTSIASGAPYAVTVLSHPSGRTQNCVVTSGSGTMGGAAVTDVAITCTTTTFAIGGTVTGLVGTGLVLRNNGGDDLPVSGDGTFTFTTPVASGDTFAVTVHGQPSGPTQTCTVSGDTGTVGAGDVTSVVVNCTTNTYTVGGTISGLAGTVVLQNNGGDNRTLTANGSFAFQTPVASGSSYAVTVLTDPATPSQTCTVTSGTGTVTNADITSVSINCVTNKFTIGGTVLGLKGTGLVLQNNLGDDLPIAGNGPFTFTTSIESGKPYAVTAFKNPTNPWQTCTVGNATGTVGGSNVTDVAVTCTTNTYKIGGTVTGLAGTGLTLRQNGGDDLVVSANGTFSFDNKVPSGGGYAVTVFADPKTPWQTCTVDAGTGSGTVTNADITSVGITCTTNKYTIGGTIAGLEGRGLQLLNNGGDALIASGTSFTFATSLESGATFDVTVNSQPGLPTQTCTVTGGTGTVGGGDVTSVMVNCTTNRYTISGTVTGLVGEVVLQNNGGDDELVTSDGGFSFTTTVESGETYDVSVFIQPTSPSQTCVVNNGSGTVFGADITNVNVVCTTNRYSIGGTVTGLAAGQSVVLRNNGADDLTVSSNTGFTFDTEVPSGQPYAVTVLTNPSSPIAQTCTVTNASGTVGGEAITNVLVTCTTNKYTVSGTVNGMSGTGMVLRNNGGDDKTVNSNGSFTFATAIASGQQYAVTVFQQPSGGSSEVCSVTSGGSGTITNADITNVVVTCFPPVFSFTTGGAVGRFGPTQAMLDSAYAGTSLAGTVTSTAGIQHWVVPADGTYQIEVIGAVGGLGFTGTTGGRGAQMRGDFLLSAGDTLHIVVGQQGRPGSGAGGGGGSFVVIGTNTPLIVAGGGGGGGNFTTSDASITTAGKKGDGSQPGLGGTDGNGGGGAVDYGPGGGGGFFTNGTAGWTAGGYNGQPGFAFLNGANGGHDQNFGETVAGGFGGGAGAGAGGHSGGGGGYSGGGASGNGGSGTGGGAGSINNGTNPFSAASVGMGDGKVTIRRL